MDNSTDNFAEEPKKPSVMDMITAQNKAKMNAAKNTLSKVPDAEKPVSDGQLRRPKPVVSVMQPVRTSPDEVLFKSIRPNFAFFLAGNRVQFKNGFLATADADIIKHVKDNFVGTFVSVLESGFLKKESKD